MAKKRKTAVKRRKLRVKHQTQLGYPVTGGIDCGVRSTSMAIDEGSRGTRRPAPKALRKRMRKVGAVGTVSSDWLRGIRSFNTKKQLNGKYRRLRATRIWGGKMSELIEHLQTGGGAIVGVDYGMLRRSAPNATGSKSFDGWHALRLQGIRKKPTGSGRQIKSWDSLNDGRYKGCPRGPAYIDVAKLKRAMVAWSKACGAPSGTIVAVLVKPPQPLKSKAKPTPEPPEPPPDEEPDIPADPEPDTDEDPRDVISATIATLRDLADGEEGVLPEMAVGVLRQEAKDLEQLLESHPEREDDPIIEALDPGAESGATKEDDEPDKDEDEPEDE